MSEKLKQCPFCKGEFAFDFEAKNFRCGTCGATVPPDPYARTVNTRPIEDELTTRIAKLEEALNIDTDLTIAGLRKELRDATTRIAELEMKIRHNALWQASEDAEERAHLEKLVPDLKKRIAELEKDNDEFRQLIHDWIIILTPDDGYVPDSEGVRQAMLVIDKERER